MIRVALAILILMPLLGFSVMAYIFPEVANEKIEQVQNLKPSNYVDMSFVDETVGLVQGVYGDVENYTVETVNHSISVFDEVVANTSDAVTSMANAPSVLWEDIKNKTASVGGVIGQTYNETMTYASSFISDKIDEATGIAELKKTVEWQQVADNTIYSNDASEIDLLVGIEPAAGGDELLDSNPPSDFGGRYDIEDDELTAEAALVPRSKTVVSSSRDGKIKKIHFDNGDHFEKGDVILEYYCEDLRAEMVAANAERKFAKQKALTTSRLFNMELSSNLELVQSKVEKEQAVAKKKVVESRINDCVVRAGYDGHVVKRMANNNEYTRTDRVLMEIASKGTLDVEFLLPSKSLRWINLDAPVSLTVNETGRDYIGKIKQIYGEVDPVSQSIQIRAGLDGYDEPLLPGMSGQVTIDVYAVREAGISGFLETSTR